MNVLPKFPMFRHILRLRRSPEFVIYGRLFAACRPYWKRILALFALELLSAPFALLAPVPLKMVVDSSLNDRPLPAPWLWLAEYLPGSISFGVLILAVVLVITLALARQIQSIQASMMRAKVQQYILLDFRSRIFEHVQRLSFAFHDKIGPSDISYRIFYDTNALASLLLEQLIPLIVSVFSVVSMLWVVWQIDIQLTIIAAVFSPLLFLITFFSRSRLRSDAIEMKRADSATFKILEEVLGLMRIVQYFGQEKHEQKRFQNQSKDSINALLKYTYYSGAVGLRLDLVTAVGTGATLFFGAQAVMSGQISLGSLLLIMGYLNQLYAPIKTISKNIGGMQRQLVSVERALHLLDVKPDVVERKYSRSLERAKGEFILCDVGFWYEKNSYPVFQNLSLRVPSGSKVGIVGLTGSGKSTLINLLPRFYDPCEGNIQLDGVDLRDYRLDDLRKQFSIVPQDPVLFAASVADNIAYGSPNATMPQIQAAAQAASAHDFICRFPDGYLTRVGQRGMSLSGGERQRIALARAFLKDAPILILDEPTSSIDVATEATIVDAMKRLMHGRTTFIIAHRLSTVENSDIILRLERGAFDVINQ